MAPFQSRHLTRSGAAEPPGREPVRPRVLARCAAERRRRPSGRTVGRCTSPPAWPGTSLGRRAASFVQATYLDTEDDAGQPLLRRPEWSASWTLHGGFSRHLSGDLTLLYVGARDDVDPITFERTRTSSYTTADIALAYSLWNGIEITGRALNLFDKEYEEVLGYPASGRRYLFGLRLGVDNPPRWQKNP